MEFLSFLKMWQLGDLSFFPTLKINLEVSLCASHNNHSHSKGGWQKTKRIKAKSP
jgi:hypothetical protein